MAVHANITPKTQISIWQPAMACVCIAAPHGKWRCYGSGRRIDGPRQRQMLTVVSVATVIDADGPSLEFAEFPGRFFRAVWFRPVVAKSAVEDVALFRHHLDRGFSALEAA